MGTITAFPIPTETIPDLPDVGPISDASQFVLERAGTGRVAATAVLDYVKVTTDAAYLHLTGGTVSGPILVGSAILPDFGTPMLAASATGAQNALIGQTINSLPPSTLAFPCGITGYGSLTTAGNTVFGVFGRADLSTVGVPGVATNELNSFNFAGTPTGATPPLNSFGTTEFCTIALQLAAYGNFPSLMGLAVLLGAQPFQHGIYVHPQAATSYGLFIDGSTTASPAGAGALVRMAAPVGVPNLILQQMGAFDGTRLAISVIDGAGVVHASINHSGDYVTPGIVIGHDGTINYVTPTTAASATIGANGAPPAQVAGYLVQKIGGVSFKFPYYNV